MTTTPQDSERRLLNYLKMPPDEADVELLIERDQWGHVVRLGYSVRNRKSEKTTAEFRTLVEMLVKEDRLGSL